MDIDQLKSVWQRVEQTLERQEALSRQQMLEASLKRARHRLRPLFWGQVLQMLIGVPVLVLGVCYWTKHTTVPHRLISGLIVHLYGILLIVLGGIIVGKIQGIDYASPVAEIQRKLAEVRYWYVRGGRTVGLAWWLLWIPFAQTVFGLLGADMLGSGAAWIYWNIASGVAGLLITWGVHRWIHHPSRPVLSQWATDAEAGASLTSARRVLDEATRFERE